MLIQEFQRKLILGATLQNIKVIFLILHKLCKKTCSFLGKSHDEILTLNTMVDMVVVVLVVVVVVDMVVEDHEELTRKGGVI